MMPRGCRENSKKNEKVFDRDKKRAGRNKLNVENSGEKKGKKYKNYEDKRMALRKVKDFFRQTF